MVSHNAAGQMLGYLYQVRYALNLLMSSDDPSYQSLSEWLVSGHTGNLGIDLDLTCNVELT